MARPAVHRAGLDRRVAHVSPETGCDGSDGGILAGVRSLLPESVRTALVIAILAGALMLAVALLLAPVLFL